MRHRCLCSGCDRSAPRLPAEAAGLEFDQKIVAVKEPVYQPPKELMYIPALAVLGLIIFMQRGRQRRQLATAAA
jgi:hypothetical protein